MATFNLSNRILLTNTSPNVDSEYGPYATISDATTAITLAQRTAGKTVGIITGGVVTEYWWKDNASLNANPIVKTMGGGGGSQTLDQVLEEGPTGLRPMLLTVYGDSPLIITSTSDLDDLYSGLILNSTGTGIYTKSTNAASLNADMGVDTVSGIEISAYTTTTGFPLRVKKEDVDQAYIDKDGNVTAQEFRLIGGTGTNLLLDDGNTLAVSSKENSLGNPAQDGYVLSSTTTGTRSWVAQAAGFEANFLLMGA